MPRAQSVRLFENAPLPLKEYSEDSEKELPAAEQSYSEVDFPKKRETRAFQSSPFPSPTYGRPERLCKTDKISTFLAHGIPGFLSTGTKIVSA